jgi:hypothetical protein
LEELFQRPRQVRYQAALRPDMTSRIDSKALSNFVTIRIMISGLDRAKTVPNPLTAPRPCQLADGAFPVLLGNLLVQEFPHLCR